MTSRCALSESFSHCCRCCNIRAVMRHLCAMLMIMSSQCRLTFLMCMQDILLCCRQFSAPMTPTCQINCRLSFGLTPQDQHGRLRAFLVAKPLHVPLDHIQDHLLLETWKQSHKANHPAMLLLSLSLQKEAQAVDCLFA